MYTAKDLADAAATLLWPLIVIFVILGFRPAIAVIIESAKSRKFTLKIGGQELTMEEANQAQQKLISDLQTKVFEIEKKLGGMAAAPPAPAEAPQKPTAAPQAPAAATAVPVAARPAPATRILWVDDHPKNNSYFVEQLSEAGVKVVLARSTAEGAKQFDSQEFSIVISDMGRTEDGIYKASAGLDLLRLVRQKNAQIPFVIYCTYRGVQQFKQEALQLGATAITSSPTELFGLLNLGAAAGVS